MANTNANPGNEAWLHDAVMGLEEDGLLAAFCAHIGLDMPGGGGRPPPARRRGP